MLIKTFAHAMTKAISVRQKFRRNNRHIGKAGTGKKQSGKGEFKKGKPMKTGFNQRV